MYLREILGYLLGSLAQAFVNAVIICSMLMVLGPGFANSAKVAAFLAVIFMASGRRRW